MGLKQYGSETKKLLQSSNYNLYYFYFQELKTYSNVVVGVSTRILCLLFMTIYKFIGKSIRSLTFFAFCDASG